MKKIKHWFVLLSHLSGGRWGIAVVSTVFPVLIMALFGLGLAIKYGYLLPLSLSVAISTLVISIPLSFAYRSTEKVGHEKHLSAKGNAEDTMKDGTQDSASIHTEEKTLQDGQQGLVKASPQWSQAEVAIWQRAKAYGHALLSQNDEWGSLDSAALDVLEFVAVEYQKQALDFTVPEGLKLFEEVSRRYRALLDEYGFAVDAVKVSHIKSGYDLYDRYGEVGKHVFKAAIWLNHAKNLYINPAKAISDIGTQQFSATMTRGMVDDLQVAAKQALLDEVAFVAIELYSGRFSFDENDVTVSQVSSDDQKRTAQDLEPIRIVLVGQTGAGKSSIVNQLKQDFVAEVDVLPSTDKTTTYTATLDNQPIVIVDTAGFDGSTSVTTQALNEVVQADLVLWVLKASQSARELDSTFHHQLNAFYADQAHLSHKRPIILGVVNHVDKLQPSSVWQPPYDLNPSCDDHESSQGRKAQVITKALAFNQKLLAFDAIIPLSIAEDKPHFGEAELRAWLDENVSAAFNVQRNRQRREAAKRGKGVKKQWDRIAKTSKKAAPTLAKAAAPKALDSLMKKWRKS
ncbi:GTPase domain-containing protein [Vibrio sp. FNV 38]|nr:GTPase domain-containing protein [Vibrio sp. FNV 38]